MLTSGSETRAAVAAQFKAATTLMNWHIGRMMTSLPVGYLVALGEACSCLAAVADSTDGGVDRLEDAVDCVVEFGVDGLGLEFILAAACDNRSRRL